jgi:hypothetical protein
MILDNVIHRWNEELESTNECEKLPWILIEQDRIIHNTITSIKTDQSSYDPAHIFQGFFIST